VELIAIDDGGKEPRFTTCEAVSESGSADWQKTLGSAKAKAGCTPEASPLPPSNVG
jgi:hypothetical protein